MLPNLSSSSLSQFVFLLYIFSKNDLYTVSLDQYSQIINEIILFIENNEEIFFEMTVDQLINCVQSVSKGCFMTQNMKIVRCVHVSAHRAAGDAASGPVVFSLPTRS